MKQKAFYKILVDFSMNPARAKQSLSDKRLTLTEKKIIEGYLLIRNNQNLQALDSMKVISPSDLPFVEGQRKLLMGQAMNNMSFFNEAEKMIKDALEIFKSCHVPYFEFSGNYFLFTTYSNRDQNELMLETLMRLERLPIISELQSIRLLRCQFDYYSSVDEVKAREVLSLLEPKKKEMSEGDIISQLVCEFMFFVKYEEFDKCESLLLEMKNYRKFHLTENFNFMKKLLAHLKNNAPIYLYGDDFKAIPLLYLQLKVIQAFEEKNYVDLEIFWNQLQAVAPDTYGQEFSYNGSKCLFSLCLDKHRSSVKEKINVNKVEDMSQLDRLVELLMSAQSPVSKNHIYEYIWNEPPEDKEDMKKLTRLMSRLRSEKGIEIKTRKGTYYLDSVANKKTG